jgi:hypothetical protein
MYEEKEIVEVAQQNEKAIEERGTDGVQMSRQPQIQRR